MTKEILKQILVIHGWLSFNEGILLYEFAKTVGNKGAVVEIGSFEGKSTIFMAMALSESKSPPMYAIDPHLGQIHEGRNEFKQTFSPFKENVEKFNLEKFVIPIRKGSVLAHRGWRKPIALLNIDGLHEYKYIKQDLRLWLPDLRDGSIVLCHDAFSPEPGVYKAVNEEILNKRGFRYVGVSDSQIFTIKGKYRNVWENINFNRSKFFIQLSCSILQDQRIPISIRKFIANRALKIFYLNNYMISLFFNKLIYIIYKYEVLIKRVIQYK